MQLQSGSLTLQKSKVRISRFRIISVMVLIVFGSHANGQKTNNFSLDFITSTQLESQRHGYQNGDNGFYYEIRIGKTLNKYFEVNAGAGYQLRHYIYYAQKDGVGYLPLFMKRHYVPINAAMRLYLSEFFHEKLSAWKRQGKFDVYYQLGISNLRGKDEFDEDEELYKSQGFFVPFYLYPYEDHYGKVYITNLIGMRFNFSRHCGVFLEGGDGALMTLQTGLNFRF